jgi:hypothetical protein
MAGHWTEVAWTFEKRALFDSLPTSWDDTSIFQELEASCESQYLEMPGMLAKVLPLVDGGWEILKSVTRVLKICCP